MTRENLAVSRSSLIKALVGLALLFLALGVLGAFFSNEINEMTFAIYQKLGLSGLAIFVFISDSLISPFPPDLALLVIAKSPLRETWPEVVAIIGLVSILAGHCAFWVGRTIQKTGYGRQWALKEGKKRPSVKKYGILMVILGALTPLPFSLTCILAGFLGMSYSRFSFAVIFRFPRIFLYYWVIHSSDVISQLMELLK